MNLKDDFIEVINHKEVKPVPFSVKFTVEALERYKAYLGKPFDPILDTGSYVVTSHTNNGWQEVKSGYFQDYFGVIWNKTLDKTLGVVDEPLIKSPSLKGFDFPDTENLPVYKFIEKNNRKFPDHIHMVSIGFTLFERAWALTGMAELMVYMLVEPTFVHDLLDKITEYNLKLIENAASIGVDCLHTADDWGYQNGLMLSKDLWLEFIEPRFKKICKFAKAKGLILSHHSCGNVEDIIPEIIDCGVDVLDPFQPEAMDIWTLRDKYRGKISFWGGLSVQRTLPYGSRSDVEREAYDLLKHMAPGGGYIFSTSHAITGDIPPENIEAFLRVANNQL
jgi:uroporphyrinogen decarboxylase